MIIKKLKTSKIHEVGSLRSITYLAYRSIYLIPIYQQGVWKTWQVKGDCKGLCWYKTCTQLYTFVAAPIQACRSPFTCQVSHTPCRQIILLPPRPVQSSFTLQAFLYPLHHIQRSVCERMLLMVLNRLILCIRQRGRWVINLS